MENKPAPRVATLLATWFGCGFSPLAPGTAGSLGALLPAVLLARYFAWPPWVFGVAAAAILPAAIWAAGKEARSRATPDPGLVVIDEVAGQWLTLAGATSSNWKSALAALALFRLFDVWKPAPVRQLERLPGGWGIVADDVMAGIYGALVLWAAGWFNFY